MPSITTPEYFYGVIDIPSSKYKDTQIYIDRYESRIIYSLFGRELGQLVVDYNASSEQRIKDIVEGKLYSVAGSSCDVYNKSGNDVQVKWNGLANEEKVSLLSYWVFVHYAKEKETSAALSGNASADLENARNVGYSNKIEFAWNEMQGLYGTQNQDRLVASCFNFLNEHSDIYPEWVFREIGNVNRFGF